ncbi:hypothetical protein [Streptomyces sp. NPDC059564]|uniref:hypothetical protein n=1 Tax=Streptomyces sp. NPDC059564 TaxID=3346865 RepID=UPI00368C0CAF
MVTARAQHTPPPARRAAGLLHLLGLTLLFLGLICTHGAHATGTSAHPATASAAPAPAAGVPQAASVDGHGHGHGSDRPADECAPVPPRQGSVVDAPPAPSGALTRCAPEGRRDLPVPGRSGASGSVPEPPAAPAVLRV